MKALGLNAEPIGEIDWLKKEKKKKKKKLKKEVEVLKKELEDLKVEKAKSDEATKSSYQDGFSLAHHQVFSRHLNLDLSFLQALDIPEGPTLEWLRVEYFDLPIPPPSATEACVNEDDAEGDSAEDAGEPDDGQKNQ